MGPPEEDAARRLLQLVDVDPRRARARALLVVAEAHRRADHATAAIAGRAAGMAAMYVADADSAAQSLREALANARRSGRAGLVSETRMSLAFVLMRRGQPRDALRHIDAALVNLAGVEWARATAQRGAIRQQLGRLDEALDDYRRALPELREAQEWTWVQRVHSNRSVLFVYRSQLPAAHAELVKAEDICRRHGLDLRLALVYENLGFLHVRAGDIPAALAAMDEAERRHRALGARAGSILVDRAELLLTVRLIAEARQAATQAVADVQSSSQTITLPQAQLLLADAALLDGDPAAAHTAAQAAIRRLRAQDRPEWMALARYTLLRCRLAQHTGPAVKPVTARQLARASADLGSAGWTIPALDAKLQAAQLHLEEGHPRAAGDLVRRVRATRRSPAELRARAWHAEALGRLAQGRRYAAGRALLAGIRTLEDHQATVGSLDLRTAMSGHRTGLVKVGLHLALDARRPRQVFAWAERGRAIALLMRSARPPADPVLAQTLTELRTVMAAIDGPGHARQAERMIRRQAALERAVRDRVRSTHPPASAARPISAEEAQSVLGQACLLEFVEHDGHLFVVVVTPARVRLISLCPIGTVRPLVEHQALAVRRLGRWTTTASPRHAASLLKALGERLDQLLLAPLRLYLADRPLVVVPTGPLQSLLWSTLPSCHGRPVTIAPSASLWERAMRTPARTGSVLAVAGPLLPGARQEIERIAAQYPAARLLADGAAGVSAVQHELRHASVAHLATHGQFRSDNPLFSSLRLADGPLTLYDLQLLPRLPQLMILAACEGGAAAVRPGDELLGPAAVLLALGTSTVIVAHGPVHDQGCAHVMTDLHHQLRRGLAPAHALAHVQAALTDDDPATFSAATSLACLGAGTAPTPLATPQDDPASRHRA